VVDPFTKFARAVLHEHTTREHRDRTVRAALKGLFDAIAGRPLRGPHGRAAAELLEASTIDRLEVLGTAYESLFDRPTRRMRGAHYTSAALRRVVVEQTFAGLAPNTPGGQHVCDPAVGAGGFLVEVARFSGTFNHLYGVDIDPIAVWIARRNLWLMASDPKLSIDAFDARIVCGDSLWNDPIETKRSHGFVWRDAFPKVFAGGGFDVIVSNPPWVAFVGRASVHLPPRVRARYERSPAFRGYKTLHGLFVELSAKLLRTGGRLGLVLPTSMADLNGYAPVRVAHDRWSVADQRLPDFGSDRFAGVFQPCMALISTRRSQPVALHEASAWSLDSTNEEPKVTRILARLATLPKLPAELFAERGYQSGREDRGRFIENAQGLTAHRTIRRGADIAAFHRFAPSLAWDGRPLSSRLRSPTEWAEVRVLIRQTARYPIACIGDGLPFRNSILAGFETDAWPADLLVGYLNSSPIRFVHYFSQRDARQGMPQVKVAHLRSLPCPMDLSTLRRDLLSIGQRLSKRNRGVDPTDQLAIDNAVCRALSLTQEEQAWIEDWASSSPPPKRSPKMLQIDSPRSAASRSGASRSGASRNASKSGLRG
jgi:methylase of polypeptide subunit release factors